MINGRIRAYLETYNLLDEFQNGFRPGRSTADNLIYIIDEIQKSFQNKHYTFAVFIDFKNAFDKVNHTALNCDKTA